jgi:hypothetical protein
MSFIIFVMAASFVARYAASSFDLAGSPGLDRLTEPPWWDASWAVAAKPVIGVASATAMASTLRKRFVNSKAEAEALPTVQQVRILLLIGVIDDPLPFRVRRLRAVASEGNRTPT